MGSRSVGGGDWVRPVEIPFGWEDPDVAGPAVERRLGPLVLWLCCLAGAIGLLVALGRADALTGPALWDPGSWTAWATGRDPVEITLATLRLGGLGLAWYLTGVTSIAVLGRVAGAARLVRVADALDVGPIRTVAQQAVGVGLAVGVLSTAVSTPSAGVADVLTGPVAPTVAPTAAAPVPVPAPATPAEPHDGWATAPGSATLARRVAVAASSDDVVSASAPTPATAPSEVRVEPGDHLWGIAQRDLERSLGRAPTEAEVHAHWVRVIEVNRDRLRVPSDPDLLLPGQVLVLPATGGAS